MNCELSKCIAKLDTARIKIENPLWPTEWKWDEHMAGCIRTLFLLLNTRFFEGKLDPDVIITMSTDLTVDAGFFNHEANKDGKYEIQLSEGLLSLRKKRDFISTLLHESIHYYLFITGEDPQGTHEDAFKEKMNDINKRSGLKITAHHSFINELYRLNLTYKGACDCPNIKKNKKRKKINVKNVALEEKQLICDSKDHFSYTERFSELLEDPGNQWVNGVTPAIKKMIKNNQSVPMDIDAPDEESSVDSGAPGSIESDNEGQSSDIEFEWESDRKPVFSRKSCFPRPIIKEEPIEGSIESDNEGQSSDIEFEWESDRKPVFSRKSCFPRFIIKEEPIEDVFQWTIMKEEPIEDVSGVPFDEYEVEMELKEMLNDALDPTT